MKSAGDRAELHEAQLFIETPRCGVALDNCIELQNPEAVLPRLHDAVQHELLTDFPAAKALAHGIARIGNMPAAADIRKLQLWVVIYP